MKVVRWRARFAVVVGVVARPIVREWMVYTVVVPCVAAILIYVLFVGARDIAFLGNLEDKAQDNYANVHSDALPPGTGARPIVTLSFDDESFALLGDPTLTPPSAIARVLDYLAPAAPWAVLVDLDLSSVTSLEDLKALEAGLSALADAGVTVLLARPTLPSISSAGSRRYRTTPLDAFAARTPQVTWVNVEFDKSEEGVVRRLLPIGAAELAGHCVALPSAPLALLLLDRAGSAATAKAAFVRGLGLPTCGSGPERTYSFTYAQGSVLEIRPEDGEIFYSLRWHTERPLQRIGVGSSSLAQVRKLGVTPLLTGGLPRATGGFSGALVVVGRTAGGVDLHQTPIDEMPGLYIEANASRAWLQFGPSRPDPWGGLVLILASTILISVLTALILQFSGRWRWAVKLVLPSLMATLFWLMFYVLGWSISSVGLIGGAFVVLTTIDLCQERITYLRHQRKL